MLSRDRGTGKVRIPAHLRDKLRDFREFRMGVKRVGIVLDDGRTVRPVFVAGDEVRRVGEQGADPSPIPFGSAEIVDLFDDSGS
ncbi:MAG: hypothetical protein WCC60_16955 [Ilumatobacteraceae bacterium]